MAGKSANADDVEFPQSPAAAWFASMFGQCWKEPSTEDDLKFDDVQKQDQEKKDGKKDKKSKKRKECAKGSLQDGGKIEGNTDGNTHRFLIDNTVLQIKSHPGVAFRYSKVDTDKVKSGPGPAKWGETIEGFDEGDGWLKVGSFYLPMVYQGVPIVTPVVSEATPEAKASRAPATPLANVVRSSQTCEGTPEVKTDTVLSEPACSAEDNRSNAAPEATTTEKDLTSDQPRVDSELVTASIPKSEVDDNKDLYEDASNLKSSGIGQGVESIITGSAEEGVGDDATVDPQCCKGEPMSSPDCAVEEQPLHAWFTRPSVGTWLVVLPQVDEHPPNDDGMPQPRQLHWRHLPSVGTWLHQIPRRRSLAVEFTHVNNCKLEDSACNQAPKACNDTMDLLM